MTASSDQRKHRVHRSGVRTAAEHRRRWRRDPAQLACSPTSAGTPAATSPAATSGTLDGIVSVRADTAPARSARWDVWGTYAFLAVSEPDLLPAARRLAEQVLARVDGRAAGSVPTPA